MIKRTVRGVIQLLGGLAAGAAIVVVLGAWRLSQGPVSLGFLTPHIETVLNKWHPSFKVRLEDTILAWAGWERALDVRVVNLRAIGTDGRIIATVPELSVSLSAKGILRGVAALQSIELYSPRLRLLRHEDGHFELAFPEGAGAADDLARKVLSELAHPTDPDDPMSYLTSVTIRDADLQVIDRRIGVTWRAPSSQVLLRRNPDGIDGDVQLAVGPRERLANIALTGAYRVRDERLDIEVAFSDVTPAVFSSIAPDLGQLGALDMPLAGTITLSLSDKGLIEKAGFNITGGRGSVRLPAPLGQTVGVENAVLSGRFDGRAGAVEVDNLVLDLGPGGALLLAPLDGQKGGRSGATGGHALPLTQLLASGRYLIGPRRVEIDALAADLGGPRLSIAGSIDNITGDAPGDGTGVTTINLEAGVHDLPAPRVAQYWPPAWAPRQRHWVTQALSGGQGAIERGEIALSGRLQGGRLALDTLNSSLQLALSAGGDAGVIQIDGTLADAQGKAPMVLEAGFQGIDGAQVKRLWPEDLAPEARAWAIENLPGGRMERGSATLTGRLADGGLLVDRLTTHAALTLGGAGDPARLALKGSLDDAQGAAKLRLDIDIEGLNAAQAKRHWPAVVAPGVRQWVTDSLFDGRVKQGKISVLGHLAGAKLELDGVRGRMDLAGFTVNYLNGLPKARGVDAVATFDQTRMDFELAAGAARGLHLKHGKIALTGFDKADQFADITLDLTGTVPETLATFDREPFAYLARLGIRPERTGGTIDGRLRLDFKMGEDLTSEGIGVHGKARIRGGAVARAVLGNDVADGELDISFDRSGLDVSGQVMLAGIKTALTWRENFAALAPFKSRFDLAARVTDVQRVEDLGINLDPLSGDFLSGAADVKLRVTALDGHESWVEGSIDLADLALDFPLIGWNKPAGVKGTAEVALILNDNVVADIPLFRIKAADMAVEGAIKYAKDGTGLEKIDLTRLIYGRTDIKGFLAPGHDGGWTVSFHGDRFDLEPVFDHFFSAGGDLPEAQATLDEMRPAAGPTFSLSTDLKHVRLGPGRELRNLRGSFVHVNDRWRTIRAEALAGRGKRLSVLLEPSGAGRRKLLIKAADAGAALHALDAYDHMLGGKLSIAGSFDDKAGDGAFDGEVVVADYRITNAPTLARVVGIVGITGIIDALSGDGVGFDTLSVPFAKRGHVVTVKDALAAGSSLGVTASGRIDTKRDTLHMRGTVVPSYALNSLPGRIPLIGALLTGGEHGGGLLAATYDLTGPIDAPEVSVNPLSMLAPSILRGFFRIFESDGAAAEDAEQADADRKPANGG